MTDVVEDDPWSAVADAVFRRLKQKRLVSHMVRWPPRPLMGRFGTLGLHTARLHRPQSGLEATQCRPARRSSLGTANVEDLVSRIAPLKISTRDLDTKYNQVGF